MDANKSNDQFPIPGIALVLIALGIFVYNDNPFNPTRPEKSSRISSTAEKVRARLWQDPFGAVEQHRKSFASSLDQLNSPKHDNDNTYGDVSRNDCITMGDAFERARKNVLSKHKQQVYKEAKCELVKKVLVDEIKDLETKKLDRQLCEYKLASRLQSVIDEIRDIRDGPFSPITQHPIFSAIAMPFGGVGGLYLIDYLSNPGGLI